MHIKPDAKFYNTTNYGTQGLKDLVYRVASVASTNVYKRKYFVREYDKEWRLIPVSEIAFVRRTGKSSTTKIYCYTVREEDSLRLRKKLYIFLPDLHNATEDVYFNLTHAITEADPMPFSLYTDLCYRLTAVLLQRYSSGRSKVYLSGTTDTEFDELCEQEILPHANVITRKRDDKCHNRQEKALLFHIFLQVVERL